MFAASGISQSTILQMQEAFALNVGKLVRNASFSYPDVSGLLSNTIATAATIHDSRHSAYKKGTCRNRSS